MKITDIKSFREPYKKAYMYLEHIKHVLYYENRYSNDLIDFNDYLKEIFDTCQSIMKKGTKMYRARIYTKKKVKRKGNFKAYNKKDSFVNIKANENRMNDQGVQCLYTSGDVKTAIFETGASNRQSVSVAKIICKENLKIADLSTYSVLVDSKDRDNMFLNLLIQVGVSSDEDEMQYIFSRYIASQCKSLGYDGICYLSKYVDLQNSRKRNIGKNYAIFNFNKCDCVSSDYYQILKRTIKIEKEI